MNGEVAQICDIAIYARHALKTKIKFHINLVNMKIK